MASGMLAAAEAFEAVQADRERDENWVAYNPGSLEAIQAIHRALQGAQLQAVDAPPTKGSAWTP
ncbi:MAG: hypothetical protein E5299_01572 [Burkholderia gladioli]|nr:MAG: hypothetical protein E5299_01572 [Burkholderia gladioli]